MDFTIPEELKDLQQLVRRFVQRELSPWEEQVEELNGFPAGLRERLRAKAREVGLWALSMPTEYGGGGIDNLGMVLVNEELGWTSFALGLAAMSGPPAIMLACDAEQKERYLLPCIQGERTWCLAITEPNAGSDVMAMQTRAVQSGDDFVINGSKHFITNADCADFTMVFAITDPARRHRGVTCFLVDVGTPGFTLGKIQSMMGRRGVHQAELFFQDCVVPRGAVLGQVNEGFITAMQALDGTRLTISAQNVGKAERVLRLARDYARQRVTFGQPIAERQAVQWMLADSALEIYAARMMTYNAAWELDQGLDPRIKISMVKLYNSEMIWRVTDRAVQVFGGMGYVKELPIERFYRDARVERIHDGPSEIHRMLIARDLLRD